MILMSRVQMLNVELTLIAHQIKLVLTKFAKILAPLKILVITLRNVRLLIMWLIVLVLRDSRDLKDQVEHVPKVKSFVDQIGIAQVKLLA